MPSSQTTDPAAAARAYAELFPDQAERETFAFMAKMPAWKDHPRVVAAMRDQA